jgi:hypothetical protein
MPEPNQNIDEPLVGTPQPEPDEPSAAPEGASPEPDEPPAPSGYQVQDPEFKQLIEEVGEDNLKGIVYQHAQLMKQQEEEQRQRAQEEWQKAQAGQRNAWKEARDQEYQRIMRERLSKGTPPSEQALSQLQYEAMDEANLIIQDRMAEEKSARTLGQYLEQERQTSAIKQQIYDKHPELHPWWNLVEDIVDNDNVSAQGTVARVKQFIEYGKRHGLISGAAPTPTPDYPTHQSLRQMGPVSGRGGHLRVVGDDKEEEKKFEKAVKNELDRYYGKQT